jgi:peptide chain release factor 2
VSSLEGELGRLQEDALFDGQYDAGDAILEIHAGNGGTDAQDWAEMVLRMYLRWASDRGFDTEVLEASRARRPGLKSTTVAVKGENAYGTLKGRARCPPARTPVAVRLRAPPPHRFRAGRRRAAAADDAEIEIDESDLRIDTYRSSGAGGQHVNKTDSAVRITHLPTGIVVQCQNERSQTSNKATAMRILRSRLAELEEEKREAELARERGARRTSASGVKSARTCCTRISSSRTTEPTMRWGTRSRSSTAGSTDSCTRTCSRKPLEGGLGAGKTSATLQRSQTSRSGPSGLRQLTPGVG